MSATSPTLAGRSARGLEGHAGTALWVVFGLGCVFYAVLAFDYFISFAGARERLWLKQFAAHYLIAHLVIYEFILRRPRPAI